MSASTSQEPLIEVRDFTAAYGPNVIIDNITFDVQRGEVFIILGGSGCGKSTMLKHMIGLYEPATGHITIEGGNISTAQGRERIEILKRVGVMYQMGALFGSMNLLENVRLPMEEYTDLPDEAMDLIAKMKENYTVVIVTHNMQQAARVSDFTAFLMLGELIEYDKTEKIFTNPSNKLTEDYITGRFG